MGEMGDFVLLKEEGNKFFQAGEIDKAIESYTKAIKVCKDKNTQAVIYRNRSACFLKKVRHYKNNYSNHNFSTDKYLTYFRYLNLCFES